MSKSAWSTSPETEIIASYPLAIGGGETTWVYNNAVPTPVDVGGIPAGTTFIDQNNMEMWTALLYTYVDPTFTSFSITGQSTVLEVGDTTNADPSFTWTISHDENVNADCIAIDDLTASENLVTGGSITPPAAVTHAGVTQTTETTETYEITGTDTNMVNFTRDLNIYWRGREYYGETATTPLNETAIKALRASGLATGFAGTYAFVAGASKYKYLAYPADWGTASVFKDTSTNLDVPFEAPYVVSVTNAFTVTRDYNVHRSTNMLGGAISIAVS